MTHEQIHQLLSVIGNPQAGNVQLKEASSHLKTVFQKPDAIPALLQIAASDLNTSVRQLAAVEARKLIATTDGKLWQELQIDIRNQIKDNLLGLAIRETSNLVRHSLAHVISEIGIQIVKYSKIGS
jgi:hypothetical protein